MRPIILAIMALLFTASATQAEDTGIQVDLKLPQSTVTRIDKYNADLAALRAKVYEDLGKEEVAITKTGDLGAALAIRAKRAEFAPSAPTKPGPVTATPSAVTPAGGATDFSKYTYETAPAREVVIAANSSRNILTTMRADQVMYIWVKPGDKWSIDGTDWCSPLEGSTARPVWSGFRMGSLVAQIGETQPVAVKDGALLEGVGQVNIRFHDRLYDDNMGQVHIKVLITKKPPQAAPATNPSRF